MRRAVTQVEKYVLMICCSLMACQLICWKRCWMDYWEILKHAAEKTPADRERESVSALIEMLNNNSAWSPDSPSPPSPSFSIIHVWVWARKRGSSICGPSQALAHTDSHAEYQLLAYLDTNSISCMWQNEANWIVNLLLLPCQTNT